MGVFVLFFLSAWAWMSEGCVVIFKLSCKSMGEEHKSMKIIYYFLFTFRPTDYVCGNVSVKHGSLL